MPDARPNAPSVTAASAFRALIEDRNIAIDFGSVRARRAGDEVSIDLARRIVVDRAAAARLVSALNACLREHESRWRITAPGEKPAFVSRAPEEVVEEQRERRQQAEQTRARLSTALERLGD